MLLLAFESRAYWRQHASGRFQHNTYLIRRKVFKLFGGAFHVYDSAGQVVLFANIKAFKLKEDIRLYAEEDMHAELLLIRAQGAGHLVGVRRYRLADRGEGWSIEAKGLEINCARRMDCHGPEGPADRRD